MAARARCCIQTQPRERRELRATLSLIKCWGDGTSPELGALSSMLLSVCVFLQPPSLSWVCLRPLEVGCFVWLCLSMAARRDFFFVTTHILLLTHLKLPGSLARGTRKVWKSSKLQCFDFAAWWIVPHSQEELILNIHFHFGWPKFANFYWNSGFSFFILEKSKCWNCLLNWDNLEINSNFSSCQSLFQFFKPNVPIFFNLVKISV